MLQSDDTTLSGKNQPNSTHDKNLTPERAARMLAAAGISFMPIKIDGTKAPPIEWGDYQDRHPTPEEAAGWFGGGKTRGIAAIGGKISGNLELVDLDAPALREEMEQLMEEHCPGLLARLVIVETPKGGRHYYYRCDEISGNLKLARNEQDQAGNIPTLIETRGEGGYALTPGSPARCHPLKRAYRFLQGDFSTIPTITPAERATFHDIARSFNKYEPPVFEARDQHEPGDISLPGNDYSARVTIEEVREILEGGGWTKIGTGRRNNELWRRPGKTEGGSSASLFLDTKRLYVFSSNALPFESEAAYSPFRIYALITHAGDFKAAAAALRAAGYGKQPEADETPTLDDAENIIGELAGMPLKEILDSRVIATLATAQAESPRLYALAKEELKNARKPIREIERAIKHERAKLRLVTSTDNAGETTAGQIFADAPVAGLVIPANYQLTPDALIYSTVDEESNQVKKVTVCNAPVLLTGRTVDIDSGTEGVRVSWKRGGAGWRHRIVDRGVMADSRRIVALADQGFPVTSNNSKEIIRYADAFEALNYQRLPESKTTSHLGWQGRDREAGFLIGRTLIQPDGTTADATMSDTELAAAPIAFRTAIQGADEILSGYHSAGTLDAWRAAVNKLAGLPFPVITLFASFAPPLLEILGCPNFIVSLDGVTSQGKTTAQRIAASVWGDPDEARPGSTVRSWDSTTVNFERVAGLLRNLPVILDDTKRVKRPAEIAGFLYSLAQGKGRGRGTVGGLAHTQTWRTVLISSGEAPITSFTEDGGVKMRVLSLWGPPFETGAALVDELNLAVNFNYGHAGAAFISALLRRRDEWPEWRSRYEELAKDYTSRANTEKASRLAKYAAAVRLAGELAIDALGLSFEKGADPFETVWKDIAGQADDAAGAERALELAYGWAVMNETKFYGRHLIETRRLDSDGDSATRKSGTLNDKDEWLRTVDRPLIPAGGWAGRWNGAEDWTTLEFAPHVLHKLLQDAGFSPLAIIGEWKEKEFLEVPEDHRKFKKRVKLCGDSVYLYVIKRDALKKWLNLED